jgi:hypothetical protein
LSSKLKILVVGDSIPYGYGFSKGINNPAIWPNRLASSLNAEVTNLSVAGYDNQGIFLNTLVGLNLDHFDLVLVQFTNMSRVILSPNVHSILNLSNRQFDSSWSKHINLDDYNLFHKVFTTLNGNFEHWKRLIKIIQVLQTEQHNIRFINGMLFWTEDFFKNDSSVFATELIDSINLPDDDIKKYTEQINRDKSTIDLSLWINPFKNFMLSRIDSVSVSDAHPGPESHKLYTDIILNSLDYGK